MDRPGIVYKGELTDITEQRRLGVSMGGLGTGTLEIDRAGRIANICVQNNWADKKRVSPAGTFFSVHTSTKDKRTGRVLQLEPVGDLPPVAGLTYCGHFPFTEIEYHDEHLPCKVSIEAFSPFVPHDPEASSVPMVFFTLRVENTTAEPVSAAVALSWHNNINPTLMPHYHMQGNYNTRADPVGPGVLMQTHCPDMRGSEYFLTTIPDAPGSRDGVPVEYTAEPDWWQGRPLRHKGGEWFQQAERKEALAAWRTFLDTGELPGHRRADLDDGLGPYSYHQPVGAVAGRVRLDPGEAREIRFALGWFFPQHRPSFRQHVGHWYAQRFPGGAREAARWAVDRREDLRTRSRTWQRLIDESSLPEKTRAMLVESAYYLPRGTWWLDDGRFILYEAISCSLTAPTVLDMYFGPALAALFPDMHAHTHRVPAAYQRPSGEIPSFLGHNTVDEPRFRVFNPQEVGVFALCLYWDMLWGGGGPGYVNEMYPVLKNAMYWGHSLDQDGDGVPDCHGVDQAWDNWPMFGSAAYVADVWMAACRAGAALADRLSDPEFAAWCRAREAQASGTAEEALWNGEYYRLFHDPVEGRTSETCFLETFAGQTIASVLGLGRTHPEERIRKTLETIWRLNVAPCKWAARSGAKPDSSADGSHSRPDGSPAGKRSRAVQSNSFCPAMVAPMCANAMRFGRYDEALTLLEETYGFIIDQEQEPWFGQLYFDADTGKHTYGYHYSDCLNVWYVLHAATGVQVNAFDCTLTLAPPRVPVTAPVFSKLFFGQAAWTREDGRLTVRLTQAGDRAAFVRELRLAPPPEAQAARVTRVDGTAREVGPDAAGAFVFENVALAPGASFTATWD